MSQRTTARFTCRLIAICALAALSACVARDRWTLALDRIGPEYVPAINMNGAIQRLAVLTITGSPELTAAMRDRAVAEGWKARLLDDGRVEIDPVGHTLDEVAALNFRVENGEFGDLKFNVVMREDRKATARAQAR